MTEGSIEVESNELGESNTYSHDDLVRLRDEWRQPHNGGWEDLPVALRRQIIQLVPLFEEGPNIRTLRDKYLTFAKYPNGLFGLHENFRVVVDQDKSNLEDKARDAIARAPWYQCPAEIKLCPQQIEKVGDIQVYTAIAYGIYWSPHLK